MRIKSVTIGGWFQRTTLHLTEIYNFLNGKFSNSLDKKVLSKNLKNLKVSSFQRVTDEIEYISLESNKIEIKITEDGLIKLYKKVNAASLSKIVEDLFAMKDFYEGPFSEAIKYLFSKGAPIPKELANIENIYPFIFEVEDAREKDVKEIFAEFEDEINSRIELSAVGIYKGKVVMVINNLKDDKFLENLSESEIFFREFKTQMARYLTIHRQVWEKIRSLKEKQSLRGKEILIAREDLQEDQKTINLIEARINQMPIYLKTRQKLTDLGKIDPELHPLFQYKFETLLDTHDYIKSLWSMTKNYLNSANDMLNVLQAESTKSSISSLTLITTVGVVSGLVNYLARDSFPKITVVGAVYFLILLALTFLVNVMVFYYYKNKKYKLKK